MASPPPWLSDAWSCGDRLALEFSSLPAPCREAERALASFTALPAETREVEIPAIYDGPDLTEVAQRLGLTVEEVVRAHSEGRYVCAFVGFCPGFGYLDGVDPRLADLPRRQTPRPRVPAGSVATAGSRTAVYPLERPGGWWLLGRTELGMVDVGAGRFLLRAGDRVRFRRIR